MDNIAITYISLFRLLWKEFELWKKGLSDNEKQDVTGFFNVIRRHSDSHSKNIAVISNPNPTSDLYIIPFSQEYFSFLAKAAELLHKAGDLTTSPRYFIHFIKSYYIH